jgi:hypothetical protein
MIVEQDRTCMQLVVFHVCNCMQMCFFMYATVFHVCNCMQHIQIFMIVEQDRTYMQLCLVNKQSTSCVS